MTYDDDRLGKVQDALHQQSFGLFVTASPSTVHYLSGYRSMASQIYEDSDVVAVLTSDALRLVLPKGQVAAALDAGVPAEALIAFGEFYYFGTDDVGVGSVPCHEDLAGALSAAVATADLTGEAIGIEQVRLTVGVDGAIRSASRHVEDATRWIQAVRSTKLPWEVELLRRSAQISELGIQRALAAANEGMSEREIAGVIAATMVTEGAEPRFLSVQTGHRGGLVDAYPSDKPWRRGEFLRIDVGCTFEGYWSDIARTAILGHPSAEQRRVFEALRLGQQHELDILRPGLTARELFHGASQVIRDNGLPDFRRHHCGHGIGLSIYDAPHIRATDETVLVAGMVLCLEVPYYGLGAGGILTEDTVVVTEAGAESFTHLSRELVVVE